MPQRVLPLLFLIGLPLVGCGGSVTEAGGDSAAGFETESSLDAAFPTEISVSSPVEVDADADVSEDVSYLQRNVETAGVPTTDSYSTNTKELQAILNGATVAECKFDPQGFLRKLTDAKCFGPKVSFKNHPDFRAPEKLPANVRNGEFLGGDLGIWQEIDTANGTACSVSQLNTRLASVDKRTHAAMTAVASMLCMAKLEDVDITGSKDPVLLTDAMNEMADTNGLPLDFTLARISKETAANPDEAEAGGDNTDGAAEEDTEAEKEIANTVFVYELAFTFTPTGNTPAGKGPQDISLTLEHRPLVNNNSHYTGNLYYQIGKKVAAPSAGDPCQENYAITASSIVFEFRAQNEFVDPIVLLQARNSHYCGINANPFQNGILDPLDKYNRGTNASGWTNNFHIFTANFNPDDRLGDYVYIWQPGTFDGNARILNLTLNLDTANENNPISQDPIMQGDAFFGFGEDIAVSDGSIIKFICNWAGPGANHNGFQLVQAQHILYDTKSNKFIADLARSQLTYAPTNSCNSAGGTFEYDNITGIVQNKLKPLGELVKSGFSLPIAPDEF